MLKGEVPNQPSSGFLLDNITVQLTGRRASWPTVIMRRPVAYWAGVGFL